MSEQDKKEKRLNVGLTIGDILKQQHSPIVHMNTFDARSDRPFDIRNRPPSQYSEDEKRRLWHKQERIGQRIGIGEKEWQQFFGTITGMNDDMLRWTLTRKVVWFVKFQPAIAAKMRLRVQKNGVAYSELCSRMQLEAWLDNKIHGWQKEIRQISKDSNRINREQRMKVWQQRQGLDVEASPPENKKEPRLD